MVSVKEKVLKKKDQVCIMEMSESEPLMKCRKRMDDVKTGRMSLARDKFGRHLFTDQMASGIEVV